MGLQPELVALASRGLLLACAWPALTVYQSLYQGVLVYSGETGRVTQSVMVSLTVSVLLLVGGALLGSLPGLYVVTTAFVTGSAAQVLWLARSSRAALARLETLGTPAVKAAAATD